MIYIHVDTLDVAPAVKISLARLQVCVCVYEGF